MRRPITSTAVALALLAPVPAWAQEASPSPSPSPVRAADSDPECRALTVTADPSPAPAWGLDGNGGTVLSITGAPRAPVTVYGYTRPGTEGRELGRTTTDDQGRAAMSLPITGSARLYAVSRPTQCPFPSPQLVVPVRDRLGGLTAHRVSPRRYVFSGFHAAPPGKVLNLYRVTDAGRSVLTAQVRTGGEWFHVDRTFLGSGAWPFYVSTGDDINSLGSSSPRRFTVIH